jgi:hypothetical protein
VPSRFIDSDKGNEVNCREAVHKTSKLEEPYESPTACSEPKAKHEGAKPKRHLSAYNWFFQMERQRILDEIPTRKEGKPRKSHGKIRFADLARMIAAKWKSLSKAERVTYDKKAAIDRERYQREMEVWKKVQLAVHPLPDMLGAKQAQSRQEVTVLVLERVESSLQRTPPNIDMLASQLGDESTQLFLNIFRE